MIALPLVRRLIAPVFAGFALAALSADARAQGEPFPVSKTTTLKEDGVAYLVLGRQEIGRGVRISSLRATHVRGEGEDATLVVSGELELKAVTGGSVVLENLWLELTPACKSLYLANVVFKGTGGIRSPEGGPTKAKVWMAAVDFTGRTSFSLRMSAGEVYFASVLSNAPVIFRGEPVSERAPNKVKLHVSGCQGRQKGFLGGLIVEGIREATVRNNDLGGPLSRFSDCAKLEFNGNNARSALLKFEQTINAKAFRGTEVKFNDFRSPRIEFRAPAEKNPVKVTLESCWFGGLQDEEQIKRQRIHDHDKDAGLGVVIDVDDPVASALGLGGGRD